MKDANGAGDVNRQIGAALAGFRKAAEMSEARLAQLVGVSERSILHYEDGSERIPSVVLIQVCHVLSVDVPGFFSGIVNDVPEQDAGPRPAEDVFGEQRSEGQQKG